MPWGQHRGDLGLASPRSQGREPGLGAINSSRRVELLLVPTLLRMSQPALAWAGARRSQRAGQRLEAWPKCRPVTRETEAGRPLEWEGVGLLPRGTCVPGSPMKMDVILLAPCNPESFLPVLRIAVHVTNIPNGLLGVSTGERVEVCLARSVWGSSSWHKPSRP
nr:GTP-binding protein Di-Ras1 isoform X2 [Vulpes vulpes]